MAVEADGSSAAVLIGDLRQAMSWRLATRVVLRLGWGVTDQAVSSITNFAMSIYIARTLGAVQFGAFALAYLTYSFALNASRGLATDPLMVRFSGTDTQSWRQAVANCSGTALAVGLTSGALVIAAAAAMDGTPRMAFLALGLTLPGLLLQDSWRFALFAHGRGNHAFLNDTVWAMLLIPALPILRMTGHASVFWFIFAWGAAGGVAAMVGPLQTRVLPRLCGVRGWLSDHRDLGTRFFAEGTINSVSPQLRSYGLGLILGLAAVGYVQAANTLVGPFMVVGFGMQLVALPEAARVLRRSPRHLPLFGMIVSAGLTLAALTWGVVLMVFLPMGLGHWLLRSLWRPTYPLVLPITLWTAAFGISLGAGLGLHALGAARRCLNVTILIAVVSVTGGLIGAATDGAVGTVLGGAVGQGIGALVLWLQLRVALRETLETADHAHRPAGSWPRHRRRRREFLGAANQSAQVGLTVARPPNPD